MDKLVAYPKEDLELHPHSWDKGLDYEVIDKGKYVTIASNQGDCSFTGEAMTRLSEVFDIRKKEIK